MPAAVDAPKPIDYVEVLWRRKWWIALGTLFCALLAGAVTFALPKVYEANVLLLLSKPSKVRLDKGSKIQLEVIPEYSPKTIERLLRNPALYEKLLKEVGLTGVTLEQLDRLLSVATIEKTSLVELRARHINPATAARLVNTWARLFVQHQRSLTLHDIQAAEELILAMLERARTELAKNEEELKSFLESSQKNLLEASVFEIIRKINETNELLEKNNVDLHGKRAEMVAALQGLLGLEASLLESQISNVEEKIEKAKARIERTQQILSKQPPLVSLSRSFPDEIYHFFQRQSSSSPSEEQPGREKIRMQVEEINPVVTDLKKALFEDQRSLASLRAEQKALRARRGELGELLAETRSYTPSQADQILEHLIAKNRTYWLKPDNLLANSLLWLNVEIQGLKTKRQGLIRSLQSYREQLDQAQRQLAREMLRETELKRKVDASRLNFEILSQKADELKMTKASIHRMVKIATKATVPTEPIGPRRRTAVAIAGFLGLILSTLFVYFKEYLDSLRTSTDSVA